MFRIAFGAALFISTIRFMLHGWVTDFYTKPVCHFPFTGWAWLQPLPGNCMYGVYGLMALGALGICLGCFYRIATVIFFTGFLYAELLDKTYYLNHYYLVTICSFLLMLVPAHRYCSLDVWRKPSLRATQVPAWTIWTFQLQLCLVYFFAGLSKLTGDWLIRAMPLRIWLLAKSSVPVLGPLFKYSGTAWVFSWFGMLFDLCIPFVLLNRKTSKGGYLVVILFHVLTALLFQIGMFPYFMITATLIFLPQRLHIQLLEKIRSWFTGPSSVPDQPLVMPVPRQRILLYVLAVHFLFQLVIPLRFLFYPGKLLWTEEGYRFSWRVMLMEKSGTSYFYVTNPATGRKFQVNNSELLTPYQERMMETQPDIMVQYAHMLAKYYQHKGIDSPTITAECYVSLNGTGSQLYIDSTVNLAKDEDNFLKHKNWILPYNEQ